MAIDTVQLDRIVLCQRFCGLSTAFVLHVGVLRGLIQTRLRLGKAGLAELRKNPLALTEAYLRAAQGTSLSF